MAKKHELNIYIAKRVESCQREESTSHTAVENFRGISGSHVDKTEKPALQPIARI